MISEALEFEGDGAEPLGAERGLSTGEGFHDGGVSGGVGDGGVAGDGFHLAHCGTVRAARKGFLDASMLVAEGDLEMDDFLAGALEAEVAGLNDAGVNGADGDFVDFAAINLKEIAEDWGVAAGATDGLKPRMALRDEGMLLPKFAFEEMGLRVGGGERGVCAGEGGAATDGKGVVGIEGEDGDDVGAGGIGYSEPCAEAGAAT